MFVFFGIFGEYVIFFFGIFINRRKLVNYGLICRKYTTIKRYAK